MAGRRQPAAKEELTDSEGMDIGSFCPILVILERRAQQHPVRLISENGLICETETGIEVGMGVKGRRSAEEPQQGMRKDVSWLLLQKHRRAFEDGRQTEELTPRKFYGFSPRIAIDDLLVMQHRARVEPLCVGARGVRSRN